MARACTRPKLQRRQACLPKLQRRQRVVNPRVLYTPQPKTKGSPPAGQTALVPGSSACVDEGNYVVCCKAPRAPRLSLSTRLIFISSAQAQHLAPEHPRVGMRDPEPGTQHPAPKRWHVRGWHPASKPRVSICDVTPRGNTFCKPKTLFMRDPAPGTQHPAPEVGSADELFGMKESLSPRHGLLAGAFSVGRGGQLPIVNLSAPRVPACI